jgi:DNA-binding response OmpR family regulator
MAKVLVIDDDELVRATLKRTLRDKHEVVTAPDGRNGVSAFETERPDLVITDIIMPEQGGLETIREIRRRAPDAKIIAMSGGSRFGNSDSLAMAATLGAADVFSKPFDPHDLLDRIGRCLAGGGPGPSGPPNDAACTAPGGPARRLTG